MNDYWQKRIAALECARLAWTDDKWPLEYDLARAKELADGAGDDLGDIPVTSFAEPDGSALAYMDLVDFECEVGNAWGGNRVYSSVRDLIEHHKCVRNCGIAEVRISGVRILHPSNMSDHNTTADEMRANLAASGIETATAAETENTDSARQGESPTAAGGDAQT